ALSIHPVYRLKQLREQLTAQHTRHAAQLEQLQAVCSPADNYSAYRPLLKKALDAGVPCVPHLGVLLKDLFLLQELSGTERERDKQQWRLNWQLAQAAAASSSNSVV